MMSAAPADPDRHDAPASDGPPPLHAVYETVLYGPDLGALAAFYIELLGLRRIEGGPSDLLVACRLPDGGVLLLFDPVAASAAGREVPAHGATGPGHIAFSVSPEQLAAWREHLERHGGVAIEREVVWSEDLRSIYVRDPAGNSVEFADGDLWA